MMVQRALHPCAILARIAAGGVLSGVVLSLCACATPKPPVPEREVRTPSDQSDPERRARVRLELAGLYLGRGQNDTALDEVKRALAAKPDLAEAHSLRGLIYANLGEPGLAEESFQRALQLAPRDGDALHNYGWFLCQQRRYPEADQQFAAALKLSQYRDAVRSLLAQGVCQARAGHWPQAEQALSRSYELDPANPVTAYNLSDVLMQRGDLDRARFYVGRINAVPELITAQSLWLAVRIERGLGNQQAVQEQGRRLIDRFPQSEEASRFQRGRFDE
jgi:type IV pilus assembly protein PilF